MDPEIVILSEVKQRWRNDIPYVWKLKSNDTNELAYKTERNSKRLTDLENKFTVARGKNR